MRLLRLVMMAGFMAVFGAQAAPVVLDQDNVSATTRSTQGCLLVGDCNWQQEVVAGVSGTLDSVVIEFVGSGTVALDLFHGRPLQSLPSAYSTSIAFTNCVVYTGVTFDLSTLNFGVTAGDSFTMGLRLLSGSAALGLTYTGAAPGTYAGDLGISRLTSAYACLPDCSFDMRFQTFVDVGGSVPEPSTLALVALAGMGIFGSRVAARRS